MPIKLSRKNLPVLLICIGWAGVNFLMSRAMIISGASLWLALLVGNMAGCFIVIAVYDFVKASRQERVVATAYAIFPSIMTVVGCLLLQTMVSFVFCNQILGILVATLVACYMPAGRNEKRNKRQLRINVTLVTMISAIVKAAMVFNEFSFDSFITAFVTMERFIAVAGWASLMISRFIVIMNQENKKNSEELRRVLMTTEKR